MIVKTRTFYGIDSRRVSLREYWWGTKSPLILIALLLKVLRVRIPGATDDPAVESLAGFEVDAAEVPAEVQERTRPLVDGVAACGFQPSIQHRILDDLHQVENNLVSFAHPSGLAWARVHERRWKVNTPPKEVLFTEFITPLANGRFLWSLSSKADLAAPPSCMVVRRQGASPAELWAAHQAALRELGGRAAVPLQTADDVRAAAEALHRVVRSFHLRRGVFVPLTAAQRQQRTANETQRASAAAEGSRFPEVIAEIRRLQNKKASWTTGVLVLIVSLGVFLGTSGQAGLGGFSGRASLTSLAIIVGVLFVHESGHWLAMRAFKYRNVQMFFIPFLGAAVTGQHYNVAGWKKAVVSLMGPLPGILLGAILAAAGLITGNALLLQIAMTALILNGFNLLPFLPLDGGWVVQALVASRHAALDVAIRVLAVATLLGLSLWSHDRTLSFLAFAMGAGIPIAYRIARVTAQLKREGMKPVSTDDQSIPTATAEAIVERLLQRSAKQPTKQLAQITLGVFEALNARPPGIPATLGLGFVQVAGFVTAIVFASLVSVGQHTSLASLMQAAQALPKHEVDIGDVTVLRAAEPVEHNTVIATFADPAAARAAGADLAARTTAPVAVFGRTALLALPVADDAGRKQWLAHLEGRTKDVFVATPKAPATVQLSCVAPNAEKATSIEHESGDYLTAAGLDLTPPWADPDPRTAEQRGAHARARRTYARILRAGATTMSDPRMDAFRARLIAAKRAGDEAEATRLSAEMRTSFETARQDAIAKLRGEPGIDPAVLDGYLRVQGEGHEGAEKRAQDTLGPLLGQPDLVDGQPRRHAAAALRGFVVRDGLLVRIPHVAFVDSFAGPLAAVRWLAGQGCVDLRYEFALGYAGGMDGGEDDEE